jgi:hypothetical protein
MENRDVRQAARDSRFQRDRKFHSWLPVGFQLGLGELKKTDSCTDFRLEGQEFRFSVTGR